MKAVKWLGYLLITVGVLLFLLVILDIPSDYWSPDTAQIKWYMIDGVELVDEKIQFTYSEPGQATSEELTELALQQDPSFFTGLPVNQMVSLTDTTNFPKGIQFANYLFINDKADLVSVLQLKAIPDPARSPYGYLIAVASVVLGVLFVIISRRKAQSA